MSPQRMTTFLICMLTTVAGASLCGCAKSAEQQTSTDTQARVQPTATPSMPSPKVSIFASPTPGQTAKELPPPKPSEVKEAVVRVFAKVATPDATDRKSTRLN